MATPTGTREIARTASPPTATPNVPQPVTTLRAWLDHLAARDRLAVIQPGRALQFELAHIELLGKQIRALAIEEIAIHIFAFGPDAGNSFHIGTLQ